MIQSDRCLLKSKAEIKEKVLLLLMTRSSGSSAREEAGGKKGTPCLFLAGAKPPLGILSYIHIAAGEYLLK